MQLEPPFSLFVVGKSGSGKSSLISFVIKQLCQQKKVHKVIVLSGSKGNGDYSFLDPKYVHDSDYEGVIKRVVDHQKSRPEEHLLLVFDDVLGSINFSKPVYSALATTFRHNRISPIYSTQYANKIPPVIRENCWSAVIFGLTTMNSYKAVYEAFAANDFESVNQFINYTKKIQKYQFCLISTRAATNRVQLMKSPLVKPWNLQQ